MKIVHLTASTHFGGPERQMIGLANHLPDCQTTFFSFSEGGLGRAFIDQALRNGHQGKVLMNDFPKLWLAVAEVQAELKSTQADVLLTHGYKANVVGRWAARRAGVPVVGVSRGWTGQDRKVKLYEAIDRWHLRFLDRVVCVSKAQGEKVRRTGVSEKKIVVIRNSARLDELGHPDAPGQATLKALGMEPQRLVLAAGRLSPEKGFDVLVEAARWAVQACPWLQFLILGEGPERPKLEAMIAERNLQAVVKMPGFRHDVDQLIPWASVVVLPSRTEGLPNVALEASASRVPVVATAVGGTPEVIIDGENGYLVQSEDAQGMAARIVELMNDPALRQRLGLRGAAAMQEQFSFAAQANAYRQLFTGVCGLGAACKESLAGRAEPCSLATAAC